jgi:pyruvate dehydrogenase (quinone)
MTTVGDKLWERLREWGVQRVFGYPGDGINGLMTALARADNQPFFVQSRHEEMSAFMAAGHAKFTGEVGVCIATSGPGAIHLLNGLYDARLDHQPVLAIVGQTNQSAMGGSYQQEIDLLSLFKDVAGDYLTMITTPEQLPMAIDRAMRTALERSTPTCLIFPGDVQELAWEAPGHEFKQVPGSIGYSRPHMVPPEHELDRAAEGLNAGERVAMLIGQGARGAAPLVIEAADVLGAGVAKALLGKDVIPDDLPFVTGAIGLLGTKPSYDLMMGCDTLLMIGSSLPYSQFLPPYGKARGVQIDSSAQMIGIRYPMEVNLVGDARDTLAALLPRLRRKPDRAWRHGIEKGVAKWWRVVEDRAMGAAEPINPQRVFWELSPRLPERTILTADSGSSANWYARDLKIRDGMRCSLSGTLATMGPALPYAIAAKFAHPDRPVIALAGDGAMQMNGNAELLTVSRYWQRWDDPRFIVLVLHNNDLNQVTWEIRAMEGEPNFPEAQDVPDFSYADYARLCGLEGIRIDDPTQIASAWDRALSADRPVVIDAITDPNVPPLPPHVTWEQGKKFMASVLKGDPDAAAYVKQGVVGKIKELVPRSSNSS